jgi:phage recombination protein Bet
MNARPQLAAPRAAENLPAIAQERLPWHPAVAERFGIDRAAWRALVEAVFPTAKSVEGIILALSYCKARRLDPMKKPVHVVPIWDRERRTYVDTVWPGIGELRTTAMRTSQFAGCDPCEFGPDRTVTFTGRIGRGDREEQVEASVTFPDWAQVTVYRMVQGQRVPVPGPRVYWTETYATQGRSPVPNDMWQRRPRGQLEKCAEAAALRRAFPEEIGSEITADEAPGDMAASSDTPVVDAAPAELEPGTAPEEPTEPARRRTRKAAEAEALAAPDPIPAAAPAPLDAAAATPAPVEAVPGGELF